MQHRAFVRATRIAMMGAALGLGVPGGAWAQAPDSGAVRVRVATADGVPLAGAQVRVTAAGGRRAGAESDEQGRAVLSRLPLGSVALVVRRVGFRPESLTVDVAAGAADDVRVALVPAPIALAAVTIQGRRDVVGPMAGFYKRRDAGFGRFLSGAEMDKRQVPTVTGLLLGVPGVRVDRAGPNTAVRIRGSGCPPLIWLDGLALTAGDFDLDGVNPRSLAGLEVYDGGQVPAEFQRNFGVSSACGAIIMWTRLEVPPPRRRPPGAATPAAIVAAGLERGDLFTVLEVERPARLDSVRAVRPLYPDSLLAARASGRLVAEFVVDAAGAVELDTFNVVTTTHVELVAPVRAALASQRFTPARRGGVAVRQVVQLPFAFEPDTARGR